MVILSRRETQVVTQPSAVFSIWCGGVHKIKKKSFRFNIKAIVVARADMTDPPIASKNQLRGRAKIDISLTAIFFFPYLKLQHSIRQNAIPQWQRIKKGICISNKEKKPNFNEPNMLC